MTGAYLPIAAEAIKDSLIHEVVVTARPATGPAIVLDVEDVTVTFSEDWSPHIQASITIPAAVEESLYAAVDPLARCKVTIDAGYTYPDNTRDVKPLAELYLTGRGTKRPDDSVTLTAAGPESLAQTAVLSPWASWTPNRAGLNEWVTWLATYAMYPETPVITTVFAPGLRRRRSGGHSRSRRG